MKTPPWLPLVSHTLLMLLVGNVMAIDTTPRHIHTHHTLCAYTLQLTSVRIAAHLARLRVLVVAVLLIGPVTTRRRCSPYTQRIDLQLLQMNRIEIWPVRASSLRHRRNPNSNRMEFRVGSPVWARRPPKHAVMLRTCQRQARWKSWSRGSRLSHILEAHTNPSYTAAHPGQSQMPNPGTRDAIGATAWPQSLDGDFKTCVNESACPAALPTSILHPIEGPVNQICGVATLF